MAQSPSPQDRTAPRGIGPWLALAACLVVAAGLAVWVLSNRDRGTDPEPAAATGAATTSAAATSSAASPAPDGAIDAPIAGALTFEALLTPADLAAVGLTVGDAVAIDAPALPLLCDAPDWRGQWRAPEQGVGHQYPAQGAGLTEYAFGYADDAAASAALARLVDDATACPGLSTGGSVEVSGPASAGGDESTVLLVDDGGRDGVIGITWAVVVRSGQTLLLSTYTTQQQIGTGSGPVDDGDDSGGDSAGARVTAEAVARAALDRFTASA